MSSFLERQRISDAPPVTERPPEEEDDVDHSLAHLTAGAKTKEVSKKGKTHEISWDDSLEEMSREKAAAEATRGDWRFSGTSTSLQIY